MYRVIDSKSDSLAVNLSAIASFTDVSHVHSHASIRRYHMRKFNQNQMHLGSRPVASPGLRLCLITISYIDFLPPGESQEQID
jgi:hypothetical protein